MTIAKPTQVATPFANSGLKNTIPQSATGSNLASLEEGFPAVTMAAVADGGTPPQGQDFNGILNQVTNQLRYAQAGGLYPYDVTFCTAIGGYPLGAILMSADGSKLWQNQVAGNTNNPDSDDTNWLELCTVSALTAGLATKQGTLTFDTTPTANSSNPVTSGGVKTALDAKQDSLTFDSAPTANSSNPVTSNGIKTAFDTIQQDIEDIATDLNDKLSATSNSDVSPEIDGQKMVSGEHDPYFAIISQNSACPKSSDITFDLSSFLPNDGYVYECFFSCTGISGTESGNRIYILAKTDLMTDSIYVCRGITRNAAYFSVGGNAVLPVGLGRSITIEKNSANTGTFSLFLCGYRRLYKA